MTYLTGHSHKEGMWLNHFEPLRRRCHINLGYYYHYLFLPFNLGKCQIFELMKDKQKLLSLSTSKSWTIYVLLPLSDDVNLKA
jgi:hypothetical protein